MSDNYLLTNIAHLIGILGPEVSQLKGREMDGLESIHNAFVLVRNGIIVDYGSMDKCPTLEIETIDLSNKWVMPAFVDSHTHLVFAAPRHNEYVMRINGKTYAEIAADGGGILNSAKKLQALTEDQLFDMAYAHSCKAIQAGTEEKKKKSGYGLTTDSEIKMLRVIKRLKETLPITVKATFLGAHAFPLEFKENHQGYINLIINEMLPIISRENLADFIDVFCDEGFYSVEETKQILAAAIKIGLKPKIHGNELGLTGGVQVAVEFNALSVDHLEHIGDEEINCLKESMTMPVALPGSSFFLKIPYTPARKIIDVGLPIALASDFNPGSSPNYNMWFVWSLACLYNGMTPTEGFNALTINAACAMGIHQTHGSITIGKKANLIVTRSFEHINEMPYWFTQNHVEQIFTSK
jgi:imidazolonepropionase